jgi:hypothetical protein
VTGIGTLVLASAAAISISVASCLSADSSAMGGAVVVFCVILFLDTEGCIRSVSDGAELEVYVEPVRGLYLI